jgi:hypothetical protein
LHCPFKAFFVEQEGIQRFPYPGEFRYPEHAEHSLLSAFVAGIAWSYSRAPAIELRPVFDNTDNELDRKLAHDLPTSLALEVFNRRIMGGKSYPVLTVRDTALVESDPFLAGPDWADAEFIQLCDLLLGASLDAIDDSGRSPKTGRLRLSKSVAGVLAETLETPWFQQIPVHRRFSVSIYPDEFNLAYPAALRHSKLVKRHPQPNLL